MNGEHVRFLGRVRRRWFAWRVVEWCACCAGVAALLGVALLPLMWWGRFDPTPIATALIAVGALVGLVGGWLRRPSVLQTAMEVDRQLDLHDLFSTAISSPAYLDPQLGAIVAWQATRVSQSRSASELVLRKLGGRAWGGVGLSMALLLTLSLMMSQPATTSALHDTARRDAVSVASAKDSFPSVPRDAASRDRGNRGDRDDLQRDGAAADNDNTSESTDTASSNASRIASADGGGSSAARTDSSRVAPLHITPARTGDSGGSTVGAGGIGASPGDSGPAVGSVSTSISPRRAAPWQSPSWPADRAAALRQLDSGHIPDAYRDLVREYFDRDER